MNTISGSVKQRLVRHKYGGLALLPFHNIWFQVRIIVVLLIKCTVFAFLRRHNNWEDYCNFVSASRSPSIVSPNSPMMLFGTKGTATVVDHAVSLQFSS